LSISIVSVVVVGVVAGIWISALVHGSNSTTPSNTRAAALPDYAPATFSGWQSQNDSDAETTFSVQSTNAYDGAVALRLDSSASAAVKNRRALSQAMTVSPREEYRVTAWVRSAAAAKSAASISVGVEASSRATIPATNGVWKKIEFTFTAGDATTATVQITTTSPTQGLLVDQLQVTPAAGGQDVLTNGSFETYSSPTRITSSSLIQKTGSASVKVAGFGRTAHWTLSDENGARVARGTQHFSVGEATISLKKVKQGYYTVDVYPGDNAKATVHAPLMVLNAPEKGRKAIDARFGIGVHMREANNRGSAPLVAQLGIGSVRDDANWGVVEPRPGQYTFPAIYDQTYAAYAEDGVTVLPIAGYWNKNYDLGRTPSSPAGIAAYANFANAFVGHYSSPALEIYNEPNGFANGSCGKTPECYLPLAKAAYEKIKSEHPKTTIVGPAIAYQDNAWLKRFYELGGLNYVDAVSFHPYGGQRPPEYLASELPIGVDMIKQYNNGVSKPLWITELGFSTSTTDNGVSERTQSDYLVRAEVLSLSSGATKFYLYDLIDDNLNPADHEGNFGIFRAPTSAVTAFQPKPAAMAQAVLIRQLSGKAAAGRDSIGAQSYSYVYGSGNEQTRVAWSPTPVTISYATSKPVTVVSEYGHAVTVTPKDGHISVKLTGQPVYITGPITAAR
jgi:hypothetical protein